MEYSVQAAAGYRGAFTTAYEAFEEDPFNADKFRRLQDAYGVFSELVGLEYDGFLSLYQAYGSSVWTVISNGFSDSSLRRSQNSIEGFAGMARTYMDASLASYAELLR